MKGKFLLLSGACLNAGAQADILADYITGGVFAAPISSQDFEAAYNQYDMSTVETFSTTATAYQLTSVTAGVMRNSGNPDLSPVSAWRVEIYSGASAAISNLTGDVASFSLTPSQVTLTPIAGGASLVKMPISKLLSPSTAYRVAVISVLNIAPHGQIGIIYGSFGDGMCLQANPNGGFNLPNGFRTVNRDAAYRVEATGVVPEPASMVALGLGLAAVVRRRRKA